jgi:small subunit ribosomal protein S10
MVLLTHNKSKTERNLMQQFSIKISLKSFESAALQSALSKIEQFCLTFLMTMEKKRGKPAAAKRVGDCNPLSYTPIPSHNKKITLLRSPHIDKKSREQFEWQIYKGQIRVLSCDRKVFPILLSLLKSSEFPGTELTVTSNYHTPFYY